MLSAVRSHPALAAAGAAAFSMSTLFSAMKPVMLTRFVEQLAISDAVAGLIVALPFAGIACASLVVRGALLRMSFRLAAGLLCLVLLVAEAASAYLYEQLLLVGSLQFLSGICVGALMGLTSRVIATTRFAPELFGLVDMIAVLLMSFMVYLVGNSVASGGLEGGFLVATAICALFTVVILAAQDVGGGESREAAAGGPLKISLPNIAAVLMGVGFVTVSGLGFAFMFTMAGRLDMGYEAASSQIGVLLFLSSFACLAGGWAGGRFGAMRPLLCAFVACGAGWWAAVHADHAWVFLAALVPAVFALQFAFPILMAYCARLDEEGRWAAIATPIITSGFAWAAIFAGLLVSNFGLDSLASATVLGLVVCAGLLLHSARGYRRA